MYLKQCHNSNIPTQCNCSLTVPQSNAKRTSQNAVLILGVLHIPVPPPHFLFSLLPIQSLNHSHCPTNRQPQLHNFSPHAFLHNSPVSFTHSQLFLSTLRRQLTGRPFNFRRPATLDPDLGPAVRGWVYLQWWEIWFWCQQFVDQRFKRLGFAIRQVSALYCNCNGGYL
jgi:hypothetical protein